MPRDHASDAWFASAVSRCSAARKTRRAATYAPRAAAGREQSATGCEPPQEGCACAGNQPPVACQPDGAGVARAGGANVCQEGTRYCRQGRFGACEDVHSYERPAAASETALIDPHAAAAPCSDCEPNCFRVSDDLDPAEGALATPIADGVVYHSSGAGLTLTPRPGAIVDPPPATVPDGTLFLSVRDGLSASVTQTSAVHPAQSEVYLLLDHAETMDEETAALRRQLRQRCAARPAHQLQPRQRRRRAAWPARCAA